VETPRVVIIDDSQPIHLLVRARLAGESLELFSADTGTAGLELVRRILPDLVLLDVEMPAPDGFEVCRQLKSDSATIGIPVIFLTGASSTQQKIKGLELGAIDYVTKPFDPAELRARVRAALRLKYLMDLLARKAQIDPLTGLWNRRFLDSRLDEAESLARRSGQPLSCVIADIDHFKSINDRFGHPFGDEVLRGVAGVMSDLVRTEDTLCRFGGEEFVLVLPNTPADGAVNLAERLREQVAGKAFQHKGTSVPVTASFGIAGYDPAATVPMLDRADQALYAAKKAGRNRVAPTPAPRAAA
jgi:diguanylate cyclase (GGDEF)-like protein